MNKSLKKRDVGGIILTVLFAIVCLIYIVPIIEVFINSFKTNASRPLSARITTSRA